jgi:peptidoglycan/xylan/chitin deacetylase (PgdA/CDA1 family)
MRRFFAVNPTRPYSVGVPQPRTWQKLGRTLLYAAALSCGGLVAHLQAASSPTTPRARAPLFAPVLRSAPAIASTQTAVATRTLAPSKPDPAAYGGGKIILGSTPHRLIFFSFDDGPDRRTTPLLLDRLDAVGIKAAFFLTAGRIAGHNGWEREQAALAREIVARGHLVGNHTVDHRQLPLLDDADATAQVVGAEDIFQRVLGFKPVLIRPPGGARSPRIDELLAQRGYTTVLWNLGAGDFQVKSAREVLDIFRKGLEWRERESGDLGGVVLLHDTYAWSVDAFQLIWADLWQRNCHLLARGEELYDIVSDLDFFYQPRGSAKATTTALPAQPAPEVLAERQRRLRAETAQRCNATDGF